MVKPTIYFENAVATITECPDGYAIFKYRAGPRKLSDFQAVMTHLSNLLRTRKWHRILGDQRLMTPTTAEENEFITAYWQQQTQVLGHGLCVATVLAQDVFARLAATQLRADLKTANIGYRVFDEETQAGIWLRAQTVCPPLG
ncbi:MAG: hypothetical protein ACRYG7_36740 [Janthinobacterium lividum]